MKLSVVLLFLFSGAIASADTFLYPGEVQLVGSELVHCVAGGGGSQQSATSRTCGQESSYSGDCLFFNETTITGRFCDVGQECGRESSYSGDCIYYNTTASCGNTGCTTTKTCGRVSSYSGSCIYYNTEVTCY